MAKLLKGGRGWFSARDNPPEYKCRLSEIQKEDGSPMGAKVAALAGKTIVCNHDGCRAELLLEPNDKVYYQYTGGCPYPADDYWHCQAWYIRCPSCYRFLEIAVDDEYEFKTRATDPKTNTTPAASR